MNDNIDRLAQFEGRIVTVLCAVITSLLIWIGYTVQEGTKSIAIMQQQIITLQKQVDNIGPSINTVLENRSRLGNLEDRINRLENDRR